MERHIKAFGIELLFGYLGFLGVGWLSGRQWLIGGLLLLVWFPFLLAAVALIINIGQWVPEPYGSIAGPILLFPIYLGIPLASAYGIRRHLTPRTRDTTTRSEHQILS